MPFTSLLLFQMLLMLATRLLAAIVSCFDFVAPVSCRRLKNVMLTLPVGKADISTVEFVLDFTERT